MSEAVPHRGIITVCVMLATIMQALDTTIANVALPYMMGSLSATLDQINWVLTSYIVAAAIMIPVTGFMVTRFGRKPVFIISVAGFTFASVLCGLAASLEQMVLYRLLQGVFGAPLVPLSQAVLLDSYPRERHGSAMALWGVGVMVGPVLGPTLDTGSTTARREWCINTMATDPQRKSILANNEDGILYRWDLTTNTLSQNVRLNAGLGQAYTPTLVGADGGVYAISNATLYAIRA